MTLIFLTLIIIAGGVVAVLYSILALFSLMNHAWVQKDLPDEYEPGADMLVTREPAVAKAFWERSKMLLQNGRVDPALSDCKFALEVNPNLAEAKRLWEHLFPPKLVSIVPGKKALLLAAIAEQTGHKDEEVSHESEPEQTNPSGSD